MKYTRTIEIELEIDDELLDVINEQYFDATYENIASIEDIEAFLDECSDDEIVWEFENSTKSVDSKIVEINEKMLDKMQKIVLE